MAEKLLSITAITRRPGSQRAVWSSTWRAQSVSLLFLLRQKAASSGGDCPIYPQKRCLWGKRGMSEDRQERFASYVEALAAVIGHADRAEPLRDYCRGLLLP